MCFFSLAIFFVKFVLKKVNLLKIEVSCDSAATLDSCIFLRIKI